MYPKASRQHKKASNHLYEFDDRIRGKMCFDGEAIGDFIVMRSNGLPAYNFAVVVDDHDMGITHVIRGNDHITNTFKQILCYRALGYEPPVHRPASP